MALLVLYFSPSNLLTPEQSFAAISSRLMVGPVVETLVYSKVPKAVRMYHSCTAVQMYSNRHGDAHSAPRSQRAALNGAGGGGRVYMALLPVCAVVDLMVQTCCTCMHACVLAGGPQQVFLQPVVGVLRGA